jgi:uncharacterized protein (DUF1330 family)
MPLYAPGRTGSNCDQGGTEVSDTETPAYFVVCGTTLGGAVDPEYGKRAAPVAMQTGLTPIAGGEVGSDKIEVLEGELPPGTTFLVIERFPSMADLKTFYFSDAYQSAIPFRTDAIKMHFLAAVDGISAEELEARRQSASAADGTD